MVYKIPGTKWSWEKLEIGLSYVDIWRKLFKLKKNSFMEWFENGFVKNWSIWNIFNTLCTSKKRFWTQMNLKVNWKMTRLGRNDWDRTRPQLLPTMQLKQGKESWRDLVSEIILSNGPRWEGDRGKSQLCQDAVSHILRLEFRQSMRGIEAALESQWPTKQRWSKRTRKRSSRVWLNR